jgi:hypothetical protein
VDCDCSRVLDGRSDEGTETGVHSASTAGISERAVALVVAGACLTGATQARGGPGSG